MPELRSSWHGPLSCAFLYLPGDCVYDNGQVAAYDAKYYVPYGC